MHFWLFNCLFVFLLCAFFTGIVIPQILLVAFRNRLFDIPDERKIHRGAVPRLGGIAFTPVKTFVLMLLLGINMLLDVRDVYMEFEEDLQGLAFVYCSLMLLYLLGMADDLVGIQYKAKFFAQVLCGVMLVAGGIWLDSFHNVLWIHEVPRWVGYPLTVLLTVFIINAVNLIDGIDGLASGLSGLACLFYGVFFFILQNYVYALLAFATLGVLVPFHYYNVWGDPKKQRKIFMGDTGSLTIGLMLSVLSIKLVTCVPEDASEINTIILAFSPLLVPCFDVVRVYFHRVRNGKNPFLPDKNHIHHRMLAVGMTQRKAMVIIVSFSMLFIVCNVLLSKRVSVTLLFLLDVLLWIAVNMWLTRKIGQKDKKQ